MLGVCHFIFATFSNEQVFTVDPYFGGTQNLGQPEKHFFNFGHEGTLNVTKINYDI